MRKSSFSVHRSARIVSPPLSPRHRPDISGLVSESGRAVSQIPLTTSARHPVPATPTIPGTVPPDDDIYTDYMRACLSLESLPAPLTQSSSGVGQAPDPSDKSVAWADWIDGADKTLGSKILRCPVAKTDPGRRLVQVAATMKGLNAIRFTDVELRVMRHALRDVVTQNLTAWFEQIAHEMMSVGDVVIENKVWLGLPVGLTELSRAWRKVVKAQRAPGSQGGGRAVAEPLFDTDDRFLRLQRRWIYRQASLATYQLRWAVEGGFSEIPPAWTRSD